MIFMETAMLQSAACPRWWWWWWWFYSHISHLYYYAIAIDCWFRNWSHIATDLVLVVLVGATSSKKAQASGSGWNLAGMFFV